MFLDLFRSVESGWLVGCWFVFVYVCLQLTSWSTPKKKHNKEVHKQWKTSYLVIMDRDCKFQFRLVNVKLELCLLTFFTFLAFNYFAILFFGDLHGTFPTLAVGGGCPVWRVRNCRFQFRLVNIKLELGLTFWNQFHKRKQNICFWRTGLWAWYCGTGTRIQIFKQIGPGTRFLVHFYCGIRFLFHFYCGAGTRFLESFFWTKD